MPTKRILLVGSYREGYILRDHVPIGHAIDSANSIAEARQYLNASAYSLVIADWRLPDGDGAMIADVAAKLGADTVILIGRLFEMPRGKAEHHERFMNPFLPSGIAALQRPIGKTARP